MQTIISSLEKIISDYTPLLTQLGKEKLEIKPFPGKWSGKEYLGHLIDSAQNNIRRFVVAQYEDDPPIIYNQEQWVIAVDYQNYPVEDLINLWVLINRHIVIVLKKIPAGYLDKKVRTPGLHNMVWLAADYNKHLLHHLHQILHLEPVAYP